MEFLPYNIRLFFYSIICVAAVADSRRKLCSICHRDYVHISFVQYQISQIVISLSLHAYTHSHNFIYTINMKSVIALALVGSAAAFAPTTQGPVSTNCFCSAHVLQFVKLKIQKNSC